MNLEPTLDRLIVKPKEVLKSIKAGKKTIELIGGKQEKEQTGTIIAIVPGKKNDSAELMPLDFKLGEKVVFVKWSGSEIVIENEKFYILVEGDILAKIKKEKKGKSKS